MKNGAWDEMQRREFLIDNFLFFIPTASTLAPSMSQQWHGNFMRMVADNCDGEAEVLMS